MGHFYCETCDRAGEFGTESAASAAGWGKISAEGRAGPFDFEYSGICPDCLG